MSRPKCIEWRRGIRAAIPFIAVAVAILFSGTGFGQDVCWDNDIVPNGFSGRGTSPPALPDNRAVSDFTVPAEGLAITRMRAAHAEDPDWVPGGTVEVFIYADSGDCPGDLVLSFETNDVLREFQGQQLFARDVYEYWISFEAIDLDPGRYHIGTRWPRAGGTGTSWWLTSNGRDGIDRTDCFSVDAGNTWIDPGAGWHMAFELLCEGDPAPRGACCFEDGSCLVIREDVCASLDGVYQGDGLTCEEADCPEGACCFTDGTCEVLAPFMCEDAGGAYQGDDVSCKDAGCAEPGACCFDDGSCEALIAAVCADAGGVFQGPGASCDDADCPTGACCFDDGSCQRVARFECEDAGGVFRANGVSCDDAACPRPGACCFEDGSCVFLLDDACVAAGGVFQGKDVSCEDAGCPQPGACCFEDGLCEVLSRGMCEKAGGDYRGDDVSCQDADCPQPPPGACCFEDGSCKELEPFLCALAGGLFRGSGVPCEEVDCLIGICWDNDIVPNGFNGRGTSPPVFPDIRVVSDFVVPAGGTEVLSFRTAHIEDAGWVANLPVEVYVYTDGGACPGDLLLSFETDAVERVFQGYQLFDRDVYEYWILFDPVGLGPGRYHIGSRWPNAGGAGTNYWLTSNGRDGVDRTDCFSLDAGSTWQDSGPEWHHAFELECAGGGTDRGACCLEDGSCLEVREGVCAALDGVYRGDDVTCEDADCPQPLVGACCFEDGSCLVLEDFVCEDAGGVFEGEGVACEDADCPSGACCFDDGTCDVLAPFMCANAGGAYQGDDVSCEDAGCARAGACCFDDGSCEQLIAAACAAAGGVFQGKDVSCDDADCPTGACCFDDGSCQRLARFECQDVGGAFQGNGVSCEDAGCPRPGACCFDDGSCEFLLNADCMIAGGVFQGEDVSCEDADCPVLAGACCFIDGSCESLRLVPCAKRGGDFQGEGVPCEEADCPRPPGDCWDNDILPNGFNGRALSPPAFPDIRVADDFVVPAEGLEVLTLRKTCIEDDGWVANLPVEVYVYDDGGTCPGALLMSFETSDVTRVFQDYQLFDRDVYEYWISFDPIVFDPGRYYIGSRWPQAGGAGTNYWLTSDGGAGILRPGCFSLDQGSTWQTEGEDWNHAFELLCEGARGACCLSDGTCLDDVSERECRDTERFALYQGDGTLCADVKCEVRPCPADLDGDEDVDFDDLVILISAWGPCPECPADIDRDGDVDFDDLLILLDTWGPCPGS